jgi:hypothetical protein
MRYGADDKFWVVVDATPESTLGDVLFQASLRDLELQFKGGLTMEEHPTLFTDHDEAETEARARLIVARVAQLLVTPDATSMLRNAASIELLDAEGTPIFEADLPVVND